LLKNPKAMQNGLSQPFLRISMITNEGLLKNKSRAGSNSAKSQGFMAARKPGFAMTSDSAFPSR
jgi:hypothetical protein